MNVLFEEDGGFRAGSIFADGDTSLQVEMPSGKRSKIKAAQVLLRFASPAPAQILEQAGALATEMEAEFLWEVAGDTEFSFLDLARDYFGHEPTAPEAVSLLLALYAAPIYFHRKGKGRFKKAPADMLQAALAGLEKNASRRSRSKPGSRRSRPGNCPPKSRPTRMPCWKSRIATGPRSRLSRPPAPNWAAAQHNSCSRPAP